MPNGTPPDADPRTAPADLQRAGEWLDRHGFTGARPTPLLAARLAARWRARRATNAMLAILLVTAALTQAYNRLTIPAEGGSTPQRAVPLLVLAALMVGLLLAQSVLDRWVRGVDGRAGAALPRRAAHAVQPGWLDLLGRPYAAFVVATFAGAMVLAASALTVRDPIVRYAAFILLIGLLGAAAGTVVQLRHLLARPVVAEDEVSLTADVIMRVEDARELTAPTVLWSLPVVLLFGTAPVWWNAASLALVVLGAVALRLIRARTPSSMTVARHAMDAR